MKTLFEKNNNDKAEENKLLHRIIQKVEELNKRVERLEASEVQNNLQNHTQDDSKENVREAKEEKEEEKDTEENQSSSEEEAVEPDKRISVKKPSEISIEALRKDTEKEITKNRKKIVKNKILEKASAANLTTTELKQSFVDVNKYCSKATFYRYLNELEKDEEIYNVTINDKKYVKPSHQKVTKTQI